MPSGCCVTGMAVGNHCPVAEAPHTCSQREMQTHHDHSGSPKENARWWDGTMLLILFFYIYLLFFLLCMCVCQSTPCVFRCLWRPERSQQGAAHCGRWELSSKRPASAVSHWLTISDPVSFVYNICMFKHTNFQPLPNVREKLPFRF